MVKFLLRLRPRLETVNTCRKRWGSKVFHWRAAHLNYTPKLPGHPPTLKTTDLVCAVSSNRSRAVQSSVHSPGFLCRWTGHLGSSPEPSWASVSHQRSAPSPRWCTRPPGGSGEPPTSSHSVAANWKTDTGTWCRLIIRPSQLRSTVQLCHYWSDSAGIQTTTQDKGKRCRWFFERNNK